MMGWRMTISLLPDEDTVLRSVAPWSMNSNKGRSETPGSVGAVQDRRKSSIQCPG